MGHAHFLSKVFDYGLDIQSATDLPRLFPLPGTVTIEVVAPKWAIGGAQAVWIDHQHGTLLGASDHRKDGCPLGY